MSYSSPEKEQSQRYHTFWFQTILLKCMCWSLSCVRFFATPWTVTCQAPLAMGFSRQEYWSGLPCPPEGDLPNPVIKPASPVSSALQADSLPSEPSGKSTEVGCHALWLNSYHQLMAIDLKCTVSPLHSTYKLSSWELSKMWTSVPSTSGLSEIAACPPIMLVG